MIAAAAILPLLVTVILAGVIGDATTAAAVAGLFSVLNTGLAALLYYRLGAARREVHATHKSVADLSMTTLAASEAALEACRVAKSIGANLRHDDSLLIVKREGEEPQR